MAPPDGSTIQHGTTRWQHDTTWHHKVAALLQTKLTLQLLLKKGDERGRKLAREWSGSQSCGDLFKNFTIWRRHKTMNFFLQLNRTETEFAALDCKTTIYIKFLPAPPTKLNYFNQNVFLTI
jgi:hypothetical protein